MLVPRAETRAATRRAVRMMALRCTAWRVDRVGRGPRVSRLVAGGRYLGQVETREWLAVTPQQALRFFFERLRDVSDAARAPADELLYNASVLAHFATTSTFSYSDFPPTPASLGTVFDLFVLDRSQQADPEIMEAAAAQCLVLTGFFSDQSSHRHNVRWYASLGMGFYASAAALQGHRRRARMMIAMAERFEYWRVRQTLLARELRDEPLLLFRRSDLEDPPEV